MCQFIGGNREGEFRRARARELDQQLPPFLDRLQRNKLYDET